MKKLILLINVFILANIQAGAQLTKLWESDTIFKGPESVAYDEVRNCLYISNYNKYPKNGMIYNEDYITKIDLKGIILENKFVTHLTCPTGICVLNDQLYIVERFGVVVFDLKQNKVETRYRINEPGFLNDISVNENGDIYVSVSDGDVIYRIKDGKVEKWITGVEVDKTNGVLVDGDKLILGVNSDSTLKSVSFENKEINTIATLHAGIIDGIKKCGTNYLVSHYNGNLYLVKKNGEVTELLNTRPSEIKCADFEYIESMNLLIIPALRNNKVFIYKYTK